MVWWIPAVAGVCLGLLLLKVNARQIRLTRERSQQYGRLYLQLVSKLEALTGRVNELKQLLPFVTDVKVVDHFEGTVKSLELILAAVVKLPRFSDDLTELKTAHYLTNNCRDKVERAREAFRNVVKGKAPNYNKLFDWKDDVPRVQGCYFCSKPFSKETFAKVRTKINGLTIEVYGCSVCREELGRSKKIKVLYFMKDGQPVHWSQVTDYVPSENYWSLNKRHTVYTSRHLELIRDPERSSPEP
jgi:hypothetical protein